jgi:hypothetical protein
VKIGGDAKACTVWARGAAPVALRFFLRDGQVICDDAVMRRESTVADGFAKEVGNVTVTVRTGAGTQTPPLQNAAHPAPPRPAAPQKASAPLSLDDDFDPLPLPASPPPAPKPALSPPPPPAPVLRGSAPQTVPPAPKPAAPPTPSAAAPRPSAAPKPVAPPAPAAGAKLPVPQRPAAPPAPKPVSPPPPAAAVPKPPAGAKHPDACPSCGRVNPGKPKQRYCVVCDSTY